MMPTRGFNELMFKSYQILAEVVRDQYKSFTPYVPTDLSKTTPAELREFYGGFDPANGVCTECFEIKSISGKCGC